MSKGNTIQAQSTIKEEIERKGLIGTLLIAAFLLTSCSRTQIGWVATNIGDNFQASYERFDGLEIESFQLESGNSFSISYDIEVDDGSLTLEILDPDEELVWEESFSEDAQNSFEFTPEASGRYQLRVIGEKTQGSFDLNWDITE